ncbi:hypothetical protein LJC69_01100 [Bacteroidales bacterium OttesenSCG-928-K22]|nr:hypothetical protein [Bacteroidales bacterium OttesenSCG-928-L14]MDL2240200.1 hypothetical protein [Bacteroidales bacterium OttesenSCG-928-K22]
MKGKFLLVLLTSIFIFSCEKNERKYSVYDLSQQNNYENTATPIIDNVKSQEVGLEGSYQWKVRTGHPAANCPGCVTSEGGTFHIDCMGYGSDCSATASMVLSFFANAQFKAITMEKYELTSDDLFFMPARSLYVGIDGDKEIWLNVPEQLVTRDQITEQFEFEGLFFTDYPVYENE